MNDKAAKVQETALRQLQPMRFKQADYERSLYVVTPEFGITPEDIKNPAFWAHVAARLKPYDHIEVRAEDGTWWCDLLVLDTGRLWAKVQVITYLDLDPTTEGAEEASGYEISWGGPHHKYRVVRLADNEVIRKEFASKPEAQLWLKGHIKSQAR